jgi:DNA adenine methylase
MRLGNVPQPFPYQGSKRKLAPIILECIPIGTKRLVEPFAGSAAVSVAAAWTGRVETFWLNDAHSALVALWTRMLDDPQGLADDYEGIWAAQRGREQVHYNEVRERFNRDHRPADFLFLLARCVKAAIRYNRNGEFNNSPDHRRLGMKPDTMRKSILLVHQYVRGVVLSEFVEELEDLNSRRIPFIVSYDGRTGDTAYGEKLPESLDLFHTEILVGRSTQATLLGRTHDTYESLYLSPAALATLGSVPAVLTKRARAVPNLFEYRGAVACVAV